eukprot:TRINITY_DN67768_c0_g1_i1.p1 TRINITY_DN67768_c0_g1~~TRINITY_DN67768_c0_g1_i1.p1  ORF type:complete len:413 (+),score=68.71 TRINITY_DN67768_c0_g1_i1:39-1277(+)
MDSSTGSLQSAQQAPAQDKGIAGGQTQRATSSSSGINPDRWKDFTPRVINERNCLARTWLNGRGGQCEKRPLEGCDYCGIHTNEQLHGNVKGPIPEKKLKEFIRVEFLRRYEREALRNGGDSSAQKAPKTAKVNFLQLRKRGSTGRRAIRALCGRERQIASAGPAKRKRKEDQILRWDGQALALPQAPIPGAQRPKQWTLEEIWAEALGKPSMQAPKQHATSDNDEDQSWTKLIEQVLSNNHARSKSFLFQASSLPSDRMEMTPEAMDMLQAWMEKWLNGLLEMLHKLSLHRVSLFEGVGPDTKRRIVYDFRQRAALLEEKKALDKSEPEGNEDKSVGVLAAEEWQEELACAQKVCRIEPQDIEAALLLLSKGEATSSESDRSSLPRPGPRLWKHLMMMPILEEQHGTANSH